MYRTFVLIIYLLYGNVNGYYNIKEIAQQFLTDKRYNVLVNNQNIEHGKIFLSVFVLLLVSKILRHKADRCKHITNILLFSKKFKNKPCFFIKHSVYYQRCSAQSTYNCIWRGILMVRSHIGNVVCRKALCVRVASSPPEQKTAVQRFFLFIFVFI